MAKKELTLREIAIERGKMKEAIESNIKAFEQITGIAVLEINLKQDHHLELDIQLDNPFDRKVKRDV